MEFMAHPWLKDPCNLVLIGPAGVGKTHLAQALCHDAVMKGHQALFISLFDLMARISRANNLYNAIEFYAKIPVLCLDEVGYAFPVKGSGRCHLPGHRQTGGIKNHHHDYQSRAVTVEQGL